MISDADKRRVNARLERLTTLDRAFIHYVMMEAGIVPMESSKLDMSRPLKTVSPEEARKIKRKFRKVWRKAMRAEAGVGKHAALVRHQLERDLGVGKRAPSRLERKARKDLVMQTVWLQHVEPMLEELSKRQPDPKKDA